MTNNTNMYVAVYLISINIIGALFFSYDKLMAIKGKRRVPERVLWVFAIIGAAPLCYATMLTIRHKTQKQPFKALMPILALAQILLIALSIVL